MEISDKQQSQIEESQQQQQQQQNNVQTYDSSPEQSNLNPDTTRQQHISPINSPQILSKEPQSYQSPNSNLESRNVSIDNLNSQYSKQQQQIIKQQILQNQNEEKMAKKYEQELKKEELRARDIQQLTQKVDTFRDLHASNFSYCQVEYSDQPTISSRRNLYIKSIAPQGEFGTTSVNFQKERHRILPRYKRIQEQNFFSKSQQNFEPYKEKSKGALFLLSRDQIKFGSNIPNKHPGVGKYQTIPSKNNNLFYSFGKKTPNPIYNVRIMANPGPGKYEVLDTINRQGEYKLGYHKNSLAGVFTPPHVQRFQKVNSIKPGPGWYKMESINRKGKYREGKLKNPTGGGFSQSPRFFQNKRTIQTPGPGAYRIYRDVQNDNKIKEYRENIEKKKQTKRQKYQSTQEDNIEFEDQVEEDKPYAFCNYEDDLQKEKNKELLEKQYQSQQKQAILMIDKALQSTFI